jgi:hypothetical protein
VRAVTPTHLGSNIVITWLASRRFRMLVFKGAKYTAMLGYQKEDCCGECSEDKIVSSSRTKDDHCVVVSMTTYNIYKTYV